MASENPIPLRCGIHNDLDGKIFTVWSCKEDKVYVIKFAIGALLTNQGYQSLFFNFKLYVNDPENKDSMKTLDEPRTLYEKIECYLTSLELITDTKDSQSRKKAQELIKLYKQGNRPDKKRAKDWDNIRSCTRIYIDHPTVEEKILEKKRKANIKDSKVNSDDQSEKRQRITRSMSKQKTELFTDLIKGFESYGLDDESDTQESFEKNDENEDIQDNEVIEGYRTNNLRKYYVYYDKVKVIEGYRTNNLRKYYVYYDKVKVIEGYRYQ
ncbi:hypothetical protein Glove_395g68 [Diversispora epigaea]|uniref:Uncharacterized protein n=1 Tax=Diversispora epigaea TaxID=1348612 RepID=A0A397H535_9GLOM|nr:hypothetical protein Glove_395g68 [Diversispora epigaea]